jgi:hypothetical protein
MKFILERFEYIIAHDMTYKELIATISDIFCASISCSPAHCLVTVAFKYMVCAACSRGLSRYSQFSQVFQAAVPLSKSERSTKNLCLANRTRNFLWAGEFVQVHLVACCTLFKNDPYALFTPESGSTVIWIILYGSRNMVQWGPNLMFLDLRFCPCINFVSKVWSRYMVLLPEMGVILWCLK